MVAKGLEINMQKEKMTITFCSFAPVGLEDYIDYFKRNFNELVYLKWRFPHSLNKKNYSCVYEYKTGKIVSEKRIFSFSFAWNKFLYFLFLPVNYFVFFLQSLKYVKRRKEKIVFMGINYFCTFCGIILKKLGRVDFVIYRVMDFFPLPPQGVYRYLNRMFYLFDKFCLCNSDSIWFTTEGHIVGREKYGYFDRRNFDYQIIPLGVNGEKSISKPIIDSNKESLVYCGVVSRYHMLDLMFETLEILKKDFSNIRLNIIGTGPDEQYYHQLAEDKGLEENILFHGFVEEGEHFRELMSNNILGFALYREEENFMKYTEPAKLKYYLSFGVPAVVSKVPVIAQEINNQRVGFAVANNKYEIASVAKAYMCDEKKQVEYKNNIKNFIKSVDVDKLLDATFSRTFNN